MTILYSARRGHLRAHRGRHVVHAVEAMGRSSPFPVFARTQPIETFDKRVESDLTRLFTNSLTRDGIIDYINEEARRFGGVNEEVLFKIRSW